MPSDITMPQTGEQLTAVSAISRYFGSGEGYAKVTMDEHKAFGRDERQQLADAIAAETGCIIKNPA